MDLPKMTGAAFKKLRTRLGYSQATISAVFGCSESTIWRLEQSQGPVDGLYVCAILYLKSKGVNHG